MAGPQGEKFLTLFNTETTNPLTVQELRDIQACAWEFLLSPDHKGTLAHLIYKLSSECINSRKLNKRT